MPSLTVRWLAMPRLNTALLLSPTRNLCTLLPRVNSNYVVNGYIRDGRLSDARKLFDQSPTSLDVVSWNSMISAYMRSGQISDAHHLFDEMPVRDVVSWNTMLSGFHAVGDPEGVLGCFLRMGSAAGVGRDQFTMSIVIKALLNTPFNLLIPQLHAITVRLGLNRCVIIGSALLRGYANVGNHSALRAVFDDIFEKDVTSFNALILGFMDLGCTDDAQKLFDEMPNKNIVSWTTLVNGYIANNNLSEARSVFDKMCVRNVVSWTVMISGYVQKEQFVDALELYLHMLHSEIRPNQFTFSSVLDACAGCSSLLTGQLIHSTILKSGMPCDVVLSTSLIDMYAKCGDLAAAYCIFESKPEKSLVCWNAIIGGCARHGLAHRALEEFDRMTSHNIRPDEVTFLNMLTACGRGGLVEEGVALFNSMETVYGICAGVEHYACMVDIYGKDGQLERACELIREMPIEPDAVVWGALHGAFDLHSNLKFDKFAAEGIQKQVDHPAADAMVSKIQ